MCGPQKQLHPSPPLSRCTVAQLPGETEPSGLDSYSPVSQPDSTAFPCTGALTSCVPEAVALVPIDGFQAVGFPVSVVFPQKPKSSDLVRGKGEKEGIDYLCLASFPFEDARVTKM